MSTSDTSPPLPGWCEDLASTPSPLSDPADAAPTLRFTSPMLSHIAAGAKRLDMRYDSRSSRALHPGLVVQCVQQSPVGAHADLLVTLQITHRRPFPSPAAAYGYYFRRQLHEALFPGARFSDPRDADQYFRDLCRRPTDLRTATHDEPGVVVLGIRVLHVRSDRFVVPSPRPVALSTRPPSSVGTPPTPAAAPLPQLVNRIDRLAVVESAVQQAEAARLPTARLRNILIAWRRVAAVSAPRRLRRRVAAPDRVAAALGCSPATQPRPAARCRRDDRRLRRPEKKYAPLSYEAVAAAADVQAAIAAVETATSDVAPRDLTHQPAAAPVGAEPGADAVEKIIAEARRRARIRGSDVVTARDVRDAAARAVGSHHTPPPTAVFASPADADPEHVDEVVEALAQLRHRSLSLSGGRSVRVLVVGETSAEDGSPPAVATAFQRAGADVATCDLKPSTCKTIPHFQGDAAQIQDLGWDLVVAHPPCTYLANSGVVWLYKDADRWDRLIENASLFRRILAADAPFVAVENSKMHRFGRALVQSDPTQYVHPWQHGHGHTKPTALHLRNLPPLKPSCVVKGREHALARLPPTPDRAALRSRTYPGIAAAMAVQWMPVLLDHLSSHDPATCPAASAAALVTQAAAPMHSWGQTLFTRRRGSTVEVAAHAHADGSFTAPTFRLPGKGPLYIEGPATMRQQVAQSVFAPTAWHAALGEAVRLCPDGDRALHCPASNATRESSSAALLKTWVVDVTGLDECQPYLQEDTTTTSTDRLEWAPISTLRPPPELATAPLERYVTLCQSAARSPLQPLAPPPSMAAVVESTPPDHPAYRPWLTDLSDLPAPPPTQRHIRRLRGKWCVWTGWSTDDTSRSGYRWCPLPAALQQQLDCYTTIPALGALPSLPELKTQPDDCRAVSDAVSSSTVAAVIHRSIRQRVTSAFDFAALWDARPRVPKRLGLTAPDDPPGVPSEVRLKGASTAQYLDRLKDKHRNLVKGGSTSASPPSASTSAVASAMYERWVTPALPTTLSPGQSRVTFSPRPSETVTCPADVTSRMARRAPTGGTPWSPPSGFNRVPSATDRHRRQASHRSRPEPPSPPPDGEPVCAQCLLSTRDVGELIRCNHQCTQMLCADCYPPPCHQPCCGQRPVQADSSRLRPTVASISASGPLSLPPSVVASATDDPPPPGPDDEEATVTPAMADFVPQSMFVRHFTVLRHDRRSRNAAPTIYHVDNVVAVRRAMADPGASLSLVTTGMLAQLPADCCLSRDSSAEVTPLTGANGRPLLTRGVVKLQFALDHQPCQHVFIVVEGTPLIILGNDFLTPRRARIDMNEDGKGNGTVHLQSLKGGNLMPHSFAVSSNARELNVDCIAAVVPSLSPSPPGLKAIATESTDDPDVQTIAPPRLPEEVAADALQEWHLTHSEHLLYTERPIRLPPRSLVTAYLRAPKTLVDNAVTPSCVVDRIPDRQGLEDPPTVRPGLAAIVDGFVQITIVNLSRKARTLASHSPVALLDSEYYVRGSLDPEAAHAADDDYLAQLTAEQLALVDSVKIDPDGRLTDEQRQRVRQLVARHVDAFATDPKNPTKTHLLEVELPLKADAVPHRHAASRVGEAGREVIEKHVQEMESRGIIRKSNSAWGSRVVLVSKKDGTIRFCVDYRDLNAKLQIQDSPLPLTVEALDRLGSGKGNPDSLFLSTLDLAAGFWTLPIKEEDKPLTAFVTHRSKYEFNYLPFGINCGPSYMCRLMDAALQGLAWETCMPYLDDCGVWSTGVGHTLAEREADSFEKMLSNLHAVFERLKWAGLSMKASKCELFTTSAEYLGHVMSREGLRMDPKKVAAVKAIDPASINTIEKVRSFLGLCSYYRRFVAGFSKISAPISDLTKEGVDVAEASQTDTVQTAISQLIDSITSEPVLAPPRADKPFIVKTDAANTEVLGGVLSQLDDDGQERVVAYYGRRLNKHERRYTVTEIELLAAVESIKNWRPYLWGHPFKLVIDHSALRWLHTMRDTMDGGPASRLMRWILKLSEYNFEVEHKPGILHKDADGVSRLVAPAVTARSLHADERTSKTKHDVVSQYLDTGAPSLQTLKEAQATDPECQQIRQYLAGELLSLTSPDDLRRLTRLAKLSTSPAPSQSTGSDGHPQYRRRLVVEDDVIYRLVGSPAHDQKRVPWLPESLRLPVMAAFHDHLGHLSRDRTIAAIQQHYFWPRLRDDVSLYVEECHECTLSKPPRSTSRRPVGPTVGRYPFDLLYADILDMSSTSDYDSKAGTGARKLIVFADSLSRWVEAIPLHKDPTSEQVLDIFMEHIVSRYGVPRRIVTDRGSNLASRLCDAVLSATGVDLKPTAAEHHQAAGIVERFNRTLINMTRASDEGGLQWHHHLPFLLFAYRATPHRITKFTPAMLLYGRELRPPAQIGIDEPPTGADLRQDTDSERDYASKLHRRLSLAWQAAHDATRANQSHDVSNTMAKSPGSVTKYEVGDRVARKLYGAANKLEYLYSGPYRVVEVLDNGRYRLQDLENNHIFDEFDVSNIRPYRTPTEKGELTADEYIVGGLLDRRRLQGVTQYLVRWRGYPKSQATWEPREELERRCDDLLAAYDAEHPVAPTAKSKGVSPSSPAAAPSAAPRIQTSTTVAEPTDTPSRERGTAEPPSLPAWHSLPRAGDRQESPSAEDDRPRTVEPARISDASSPASAADNDRPRTVEPARISDASSPASAADPAANVPADAHLPYVAKFEKGRWYYGRRVDSPKGPKTRFLPAANFTPAELESDHFESLRSVASAALYADPVVATVFHATARKHASKLWFYWAPPSGTGPYVWCHHRSDSAPLRRQLDTFGGNMDPADGGSYATCALRELDEEATLHPSWRRAAAAAVKRLPGGDERLELVHPSRNTTHVVAVWFVAVTGPTATPVPEYTALGLREIVPDSPGWRTAASVADNLSQFRFAAPIVRTLRRVFEIPETAFAEADHLNS